MPTTDLQRRSASDPLRIVLFGMPHAGKTSLLGALSQAAATQERLLQGKLLDRTDGLAILRRQVYEEQTRQTPEEIVPYPVTFEPYTGGTVKAVLYDCDGRIANEMLSQKKSLTDAKKSSLSAAVLGADALILTVDASAPPGQIDSDFREFGQFLSHLNTYRAERHEVGGLPVYLVLTKCDLLADRKSTEEQWIEIVCAKESEVEERFKEFLATDDLSGSVGFGSIELAVTHTATKHPQLKDDSTPSREPYGVAELFVGVFRDAERFRSRFAIAQKRLAWTIGLSSILLLVIVGVAVWLIVFRTPERSLALSSKLENYKAREGLTVNSRLNANLLKDRFREITELKDDREFKDLSDENQKFIVERRVELDAYIKYRDELMKYYPLSTLKSFGELTKLEERLKTELMLPEAYRSEWGATDAAELRNRLIKDIPVLRAAYRELENFYEALFAKGRQLLATTELNSKWEAQVNALLEEEKKLPFTDSDRAKGATYQLDEVLQLQNTWQPVRTKMVELRNLGLATGLLGDASGTQPILALLDLADDANLTKIATERMQALKSQYPDAPNWKLDRYPDTIRPQLETRLKKLIDASLHEGRKWIANKLKSSAEVGKETIRDWLNISDWLLTPEVQPYREFNLFLTRLYDPAASDPINALIDFLRKPSFAIELREVKLVMPDTLDGKKLVPQNPLLIVFQPADGVKEKSLSFHLLGEPTREKDGRTAYSYLLKEGESRVSFRPGDSCSAAVLLKEGATDWQLSWAESQSQMYRFERLSREPRLHDAAKPSRTGTLMDRVQLVVVKGSLPTIPALLPGQK